MTTPIAYRSAYTGGFIWDWVDQGLTLRPGLHTKRSVTPPLTTAKWLTPIEKAWAERVPQTYLYGGDFKRFPASNRAVPSDANFCINGVMTPDRQPHPAAWEMKRCARLPSVHTC